MSLILIFISLFIFCNFPVNNDSSQAFDRTQAIGNWYKYKDVYTWNYSGEGSGSETELANDTSEILMISEDTIIRNVWDESSCHIHWEVPFSLNSNLLSDNYFTGAEDGYIWKTTIRKENQFLVLTMNEDEEFGVEKTEIYYAPFNSNEIPANWPADTCSGVEYFFQ